MNCDGVASRPFCPSPTVCCSACSCSDASKTREVASSLQSHTLRGLFCPLHGEVSQVSFGTWHVGALDHDARRYTPQCAAQARDARTTASVAAVADFQVVATKGRYFSCLARRYFPLLAGRVVRLSAHDDDHPWRLPSGCTTSIAAACTASWPTLSDVVLFVDGLLCIMTQRMSMYAPAMKGHALLKSLSRSWRLGQRMSHEHVLYDGWRRHVLRRFSTPGPPCVLNLRRADAAQTVISSLWTQASITFSSVHF